MSPAPYRIRLARRGEIASLPEIERRAGRRGLPIEIRAAMRLDLPDPS